LKVNIHFSRNSKAAFPALV